MTETPRRNDNWQQQSQPILNAPASVIGLIGVLVAIHVALTLAGDNWIIWADQNFAMVMSRYGNEPPPYIQGAQYWSFITHAFLHGGWDHLLFNCLWLLIFGTPVARVMGSRRFFIICAVAAVSGAAASLALHWGERVVMIGASGAVSGLLAAAIPLMYGRRTPQGYRPLLPGELIRDRRAVIFMAVFLLITLFSGASGFTGQSFMDEGGIAWEAHLGGFVGGLATFYAMVLRQMRQV